MAFTDKSDLFGSVHEDGINRVVHHLMRQRPSLFNYATAVFRERPELFCEKIEPAERVLAANNPLFTEQAPLPILGTPIPFGVNFCVPLTHVQLDFHPSDVTLPRELGALPEQHFSLYLRACAGIDCPPKGMIEEVLPLIERTLLEQQQLAIGDVKEGEDNPRPPNPPSQDVTVLPTRKLGCFCLELHAVGHFEWGGVSGSQQQWLKPKLDALEITDLTPVPMENAIECYLATVLKLGILPRLIVPTEKMVLDITALLEKQGLELGKQVTLAPASVPADVPHNPAIEEDQLKAFINLSVTEGGA